MGTTTVLLGASGSTVGVDGYQQQKQQLLQVQSSAVNSASVSPTLTLVGLVGTDESVEDDDARLRPPIRDDQTTESSFDDEEDDEGEEAEEQEEDSKRSNTRTVPVATVVEHCKTSDRQLSPLDGASTERNVILLHDISPTVTDDPDREARHDTSCITFL